MEFNAEKEVENVIQFIREYYHKNNLGGVIIGISGGKDSAIVSALFTRALGKEKVIGVTMPCHSKEKDKSDAEVISDYFGFPLYNFDLTKTFKSFKQEFEKLAINKNTSNSDLNLKPRLRMATLYYFAALFGDELPYLVAGTGNQCEIYVGYFTKGGDGMSDINVLANYSVSQVIAMGDVLEVPKEVLYKNPSDGLGDQTDEDKLGVTYNQIESYINGEELDEETNTKIKTMHQRNSHKAGIVYYERGINNGNN